MSSDFVRKLPLAQEDEVFPAEIATVAIKPMQPRKQKASPAALALRLFGVLGYRLFWASRVTCLQLASQANLVSFSPRLSEDPDVAEKQKAPGMFLGFEIDSRALWCCTGF